LIQIKCAATRPRIVSVIPVGAIRFARLRKEIGGCHGWRRSQNHRLAMIVFDIEDALGIEIPYNVNEEADSFKTVGSVVDRVRALIGNKVAAA
jgi:hypothetical protein